MYIHNVYVNGAIDEETRCEHYFSEKDRIAIKFYCCKRYYSCYFCHREAGCGKEAVWPFERFTEKAILCGACGKQLTIKQYLSHEGECPSCQASFNPGCSTHEHLYFQTENK